MYRGPDLNNSPSTVYTVRKPHEREYLAQQAKNQAHFEDSSDDDEGTNPPKKRDRDMTPLDWVDYANRLELAVKKLKTRKHALKHDNYVLYQSIKEKEKAIARLQRENKHLREARLLVIKEEDQNQHMSGMMSGQSGITSGSSGNGNVPVSISTAAQIEQANGQVALNSQRSYRHLKTSPDQDGQAQYGHANSAGASFGLLHNGNLHRLAAQSHQRMSERYSNGHKPTQSVQIANTNADENEAAVTQYLNQLRKANILVQQSQQQSQQHAQAQVQPRPRSRTNGQAAAASGGMTTTQSVTHLPVHAQGKGLEGSGVFAAQRTSKDALPAIPLADNGLNVIMQANDKVNANVQAAFKRTTVDRQGALLAPFSTTLQSFGAPYSYYVSLY